MRIIDKLDEAVRAHRAGNFEVARIAYREILVSEPDNPEALHLLGVVLHQLKRSTEAVEFIRHAIALTPDRADFYANLGVVLRASGKLDEAVGSFQHALRLKPDHADASCSLGSALRVQGKLSEAVLCLRRALQLNPEHAEIYNNLGNALREQGMLDEAMASYEQVLRLQPHLAEAHNNMAALLRDQGKLDEAIAGWQTAIRINPDYVEAHTNLGCVLNDRKRHEEAVASHQRALQLNPDYADAYNNLGTVFHDLGRHAEAVQNYDRALQLKPEYPEAHYNRGIALAHQGMHDLAASSYEQAIRFEPGHIKARNNLALALVERGLFDEAMANYQLALRSDPDHAETHYNSSLLYLLLGDFENGWREYEWRDRIETPVCGQFRQPRWDGSRLPDKTIFVHAEQGLGDTLQFIRYAALVKQRVGHVVMRCQAGVRRLLQGVAGVDVLISDSERPPAFDVHVPLLSLPSVFQTHLTAIPRDVPYLVPDANLVQHWRCRLDEISGFRVGISWQGNPSYPPDRFRSIPLSQFAWLAELPEVALISVQKGHGVEQLEQVSGQFDVFELGDDFDETMGAFMDSAAVLQSLDLLITSDTAIAHLAGALGVPVWVALSLIPDFRWQLERDDSPWYPTMRLFRQRRRGDWDQVFHDIRTALSERLTSSACTP